MATEKAAPSAASIGKGVNEDPALGHQRGNEDAPDRRSAEETAKADPWVGKLPNEILAMDSIPENMKDIERMMGLDIGDKSLETGPAGDGQVHRIKDDVQLGKATPLELPVQGDPAAAATPATEAAKPDPAAAAAPAADAVKPAEPAKERLLARDGKTEIPYSVLADTRRKLDGALKRIAELEAGKAPDDAAAGDAGGTTEDQAKAAAQVAAEGQITDEQIEALRKEYPDELVNIIKGAVLASRAAQADTTNLREQAEAAQQSRLEVVAQGVQDVIDADPVLSDWQNRDEPDLWEAAVATDDLLRQMPAWADKPFAERVVEVKRRVSADFGIELPAAPAAAAPTAATPTEQKPSLQQRAEAAVAAATDKARVPISHSDLPAGHAPAQSEQERAAGMSPHQLEKLFESAKTPAQLDALLARIA